LVKPRYFIGMALPEAAQALAIIINYQYPATGGNSVCDRVRRDFTKF
jgi:hypothetical protein